MSQLKVPRWCTITRAAAVSLRSACGRFQYPLAVRPSFTWRSWRVVSPHCPAAPPVGEQRRDERLARIEAVLLLAREPLHARRLARFAHLADGTEARTLVLRLSQLYDQEQRAFYVAEIGGGYQLRTRKSFAPWLRRLQHIPPEVRLTQPALETLAVIAYRQPIVRAEIDAIRGVHCGEVIRQLMERDLVRVAGRSEEIGRPYYYGTTRKFLQVFGLRDLSDLPRADLLRLPVVTFPVSESGKEQQRGEGDLAVTFMTGACVMDEKKEKPFGEEIWGESPSVQPLLRAEDDQDEWDDESEGEADDEDDEDDDDEEDDEDWEDEEDEDWDEEDEELDEDEADDEDDWDEEDDEEWEEVEDSDEEWEEEEDDKDEDDEDDEEAEEEWEEDEGG